ncbi:MAG TPA: nuclear transport factor 2 family protein, partial [Vicinamibacteria bacterium]|nr:nuclear transport factor 2 family protein [Vicinamibacteria bacterium]
MKTRRWALVVLGAAVAGVWGAATAWAGDTEKAVLAAHDKRIALTIAGDLTGLAAMMTDDLTYTHSSGVEESKAQFLEGLKSGKYLYREITPR